MLLAFHAFAAFLLHGKSTSLPRGLSISASYLLTHLYHRAAGSVAVTPGTCTTPPAHYRHDMRATAPFCARTMPPLPTYATRSIKRALTWRRRRSTPYVGWTLTVAADIMALGYRLCSPSWNDAAAQARHGARGVGGYGAIGSAADQIFLATCTVPASILSGSIPAR